MKTGREHWRSRGAKPPPSNQEVILEYASSAVRKWGTGAYGSVTLGGVVAFVVGLVVGGGEGLWGGRLWGDSGVGLCGWGNVLDGLFIFRVGGEDGGRNGFVIVDVK